jgi:hypothetical protein
MIRLEAHKVDRDAASSMVAPAHDGGTADDGAFQRTLEELAGRWYECRSVPLAADSSRQAHQPADSPAQAWPPHGGAQVPMTAAPEPEATGVEPAGNGAGPVATRFPAAGSDPGPQTPAAAAWPAAVRAPADDRNANARLSSPLAFATGVRLLTQGPTGSPRLPNAASILTAPGPDSPVSTILRTAPANGVASSNALSSRAHSTGAYEAPAYADTARTAMSTPSAAVAPPLVLTVLNAASGRVTLAMRCEPTLRATALALARHWIDELSLEARADASIVLNGEPVSPEPPRRS